ncbi:MAG: hypothetical protein U0M66_00710 [Bacilli bacterium]|nr:hypothetical protein [Bacilli bacterium]
MFFNSNNCCGGMMFDNQCCQNDWQNECPCGPVVEPVIERCVSRDICHTVEHG